MKSIFKIILVTLVLFIVSCDLYPDWTEYVEYSDTYPISGEYYVRDFDINTDTLVTDWYQLYIYNKSFNPTKDSIWIDNRTGHPAGVSDYGYKFKIKCKADTNNLSFNVEKSGDIVAANVNPIDSAITVTIANSQVWDMSEDISDPTPDSIYFEFTYYDKFGVEKRTLKVAGHRKTGWEFPEYSDPM